MPNYDKYKMIFIKDSNRDIQARTHAKYEQT